MADQGQVLVTGGSGFVGGYCIAALLDAGHAVRTTLRDPAREPLVRQTLSKITGGTDRLSFAVAELNADAGWAEAVRGCDYVLHVASPLPTRNPKDDDELVRPARDGALRVLAAARDAGVKRVVLTASTASVAYGRGGRSAPFTEADWSDPADRQDSSAYERSKTIAERAAWDWLAREGGGLELATVNPGAVLGPVLGHDTSASIQIVQRLLDGSLPGLPHFGWPLVDVRDIADLHYRAMLAPAAAGQRYIGAGPFFWMQDIAAVLRARLGARASKVPRRRLPDWLVRLSAMVDPMVRERLFELSKVRTVSSDKARRELGWAPRSNEEAIVATAESLFAEGVLAA